MNILDYLATEFASFDEKPFNPVDSVILSQFCMVRMELIAPWDRTGNGPPFRASAQKPLGARAPRAVRRRAARRALFHPVLRLRSRPHQRNPGGACGQPTLPGSEHRALRKHVRRRRARPVRRHDVLPQKGVRLRGVPRHRPVVHRLAGRLRHGVPNARAGSGAGRPLPGSRRTPPAETPHGGRALQRRQPGAVRGTARQARRAGAHRARVRSRRTGIWRRRRQRQRIRHHRPARPQNRAAGISRGHAPGNPCRLHAARRAQHRSRHAAAQPVQLGGRRKRLRVRRPALGGRVVRPCRVVAVARRPRPQPDYTYIYCRLRSHPRIERPGRLRPDQRRASHHFAARGSRQEHRSRKPRCIAARPAPLANLMAQDTARSVASRFSPKPKA